MSTPATILVPAAAGLTPITPGVIDTGARDVYLMGQCHALAYALATATGWPVVARMFVADADLASGGRLAYCARGHDEDGDVDRDRLLAVTVDRARLTADALHFYVRADAHTVVDIDGPHDLDVVHEQLDDTEYLMTANPVDLLHLAGPGPAQRRWLTADLAAAATYVPAVLAAVADDEPTWCG